MTQGFQQQDPAQNFAVPKSEPAQQHGRKPDGKPQQPARPPRAFEPRPGH